MLRLSVPLCKGLLGFCIFALASAAIAQAEDASSGDRADSHAATAPATGDSRMHGPPRFRGRTLMLDINARVIEQNQTVIWNEAHQKTTIPGHPVGIKIVGANIIVVAQFTPYIRRGGVQKFLVAQGQIWMDIPEQGIRYHTSMQTIPLEFGESIYFFPLGPQRDEDAACIEVMLTLYPYEEN
ncbi:MAG: hypothetical protein LBI06_06930 [Treponema sp.]|jgi:hypothetical protein|nr:hypothetical protein [Treponema sp.]